MAERRRVSLGGSILCLLLLACSSEADDKPSGTEGSGAAGAGIGGASGSAGAGGVGGDGSGRATGGGAGEAGAGGAAGTAGASPVDASLPDAGATDDGGNGEAEAAPRDARAEASGDGAKLDATVPYDPCPPKGTPCVALPLGDSITQGAGSPAPGGGYRVELFHQAVSHGQSITFVGSAASGPTQVDMVPFPRAHEGHGGFTIEQISDLITTNDTIRTYKPDIVMLELGTNNVRSANDAGTAQIPRAIDALGSLVDKILASDSHLLVIVAQITPTQSDDSEARVRAYNAMIPALVQARAAAGKHVAMVDVFSRFVANPDYRTAYFGSEVHPNGAGYVVLGDAWYSAVGPLLR
jgi:lysophospholipase L1-like esterase